MITLTNHGSTSLKFKSTESGFADGDSDGHSDGNGDDDTLMGDIAD